MEGFVSPAAGDPAYNPIAAEYYEPRHLTSRNFDEATLAALPKINPVFPDGLVLEPGCGRGRCGEYLGLKASRVIQLDNSATMLSLPDREEAALRILHDAERLPFLNGEFAGVAAFLCDAFLGMNFLCEAKRVLKPGGVLVGTTPSKEWGSALRKRNWIGLLETRFMRAKGAEVVIPSALFSVEQLRQMLDVAGFDGSVINVTAHTLPESAKPVSPDIDLPAEATGVSPHAIPLLTVFTARLWGFL